MSVGLSTAGTCKVDVTHYPDSLLGVYLSRPIMANSDPIIVR